MCYGCILISNYSVNNIMETPKEVVIYLTLTESHYYLPFVEALNTSKSSIFCYKEYRIPSTLTEEAIEECVKYVQKLGKSCVVSFEDYTTTAAAVVNKRLGYPYPSLLSQIYCSNKLLTRTLVDDFDWFFGFNLDHPVESVLTKAHGHRCMLKPTMLSGGKAAYRCNDAESLRIALQTIRSDKDHCEKINEQHAELVKVLSQDNQEVAEQCTQYMIEELIEVSNTNTYQFCMEAFITKEGKVIPYSLVEELLFKNGMFIGDLIPPIHLEGSLQACEDYVIDIGKKLHQLGFQNQAFNIEFWKLPNGKFRLIEINPRTATPYDLLYEQYCGRGVLDDVVNLVVHGKEPLQTPFSKLKEQWPVHKGDSNANYSFIVNLTTRVTGKATNVFDYHNIDEMFKREAPLFHRTPRDTVLTELNKTYVGTSMVQIVVQGSWNHIVTQAKDLRKSFYKDCSQCEESTEYPDYFELV